MCSKCPPAYQVIVPTSFSSFFLAPSIDCEVFFIWNLRCYIAFTETSHKSRKRSAIGQVLQGIDPEILRFTCGRFIGDCSCEQLGNVTEAILRRPEGEL